DSFDRLEIMQYGRIDACLHVVWHHLLGMALLIALRPDTRLIVEVPIPGIDRLQTLRCLKTQSRHSLQIKDKCDDLLLSAEIEVVGVLDGVHGVAASVSECDDVRLRGLRLEQER